MVVKRTKCGSVDVDDDVERREVVLVFFWVWRREIYQTEEGEPWEKSARET